MFLEFGSVVLELMTFEGLILVLALVAISFN